MKNYSALMKITGFSLPGWSSMFFRWLIFSRIACCLTTFTCYCGSKKNILLKINLNNVRRSHSAKMYIPCRISLWNNSVTGLTVIRRRIINVLEEKVRYSWIILKEAGWKKKAISLHSFFTSTRMRFSIPYANRSATGITMDTGLC